MEGITAVSERLWNRQVIYKNTVSEAKKWKAILKRLLDVTLFLAFRGLPFQSDSTKTGDVNNSNFFGI
jgi:hypothetical protein